jgi:hypothetical protein
MRITDHRYSRDLERHHLALRMIRHEARTCTIRSYTTLTDDRIRKLYRSYFATSTDAGDIRRKRGKSPRRISFFLRNAPAHLDASLLAGLLVAVGLLDDKGNPPAGSGSLDFGRLFCDAFETYQSLWDTPRMSFEHAWFLFTAVARGDDLKLDRCPVCDGAFVRDVLAPPPRRCPLCRMKSGARGIRRLQADRRSAAGLLPRRRLPLRHD